jgi:hypothetical protein
LYAAWAGCLREHGVDLADPPMDDQGSVTINVPHGIPMQTFQNADRACDSLHKQARQAAGQGSQDKPNPGVMLAFSKCMRAHGVPGFPDPSASGNLQITSKGNSDLNPDSPAFQKARRACEDKLPNHGRGGEKITAGAGPGDGPSGPGGPGGALSSGVSVGG